MAVAEDSYSLGDFIKLKMKYDVYLFDEATVGTFRGVGSRGSGIVR